MTGGKKTKILGDLTSIISALEVVLHEDALYKSTTLLYFTLYLCRMALRYFCAQLSKMVMLN